MKKVIQIVLVMMVLICIYRYTKSEVAISLAQEPDKEDYASETDREIENETENEPLEQIRTTVIGDVEILEKSLQATIEVEGWNRVRTWNLKYPYFSGDGAALTRKINDQIYEWVRERNMDDSDELYYIELTYEITYMDEHIVSILFEGDGGGSSYYGNSHGMSFDLKTGELLSLTDFYEWSEWKDLMENAMEQDQLRAQILRGYTELEEDENREYLKEYFITLFQENSDLEQVNLDYFIKDGYLYFITHAYPSCREDSYVKWEVPFWDGSSQTEKIIQEQKADVLQNQNIEEIVNIYNEFLKGKRIDEITVPTGEEGSHYPTKYAFSDVTGDGIPELHVNSARYYYIFKYNNGEIIRLLDLSPYPYYYALKNGGFICHRFGAGPKSDEYAFYIFDDMGIEQIRDEIEWTVLYE